MSQRLSKLLGDLQSKVSAAVQSHGAPASYGPQSNGGQFQYGPQNPCNTYPSQGASRPQSAPPHHEQITADSPPPYGCQDHHAVPYGSTNPQAAPALHGPPAHGYGPHDTWSHYGPPAPTGSPYPPYGQPTQNPPPASCDYIPTAPSAPYCDSHSYPSQSQHLSPHTPVPGPDSFPSRVSIRSSLFGSDFITIHAADSPSAPPLYAFRTSMSKPHIVMFHPDTRTELGNATFSTMGSSAQLSLRGQPMKMKQSTLGDKFTFESARGTLRWKVNGVTGSMSKLVDGQGGTLAKCKSGGIPGMGKKSVEIYVPCDQQLFELILLSFMAARELNKQNEEVVSEVVQAVTGI